MELFDIKIDFKGKRRVLGGFVDCNLVQMFTDVQEDMGVSALESSINTLGTSGYDIRFISVSTLRHELAWYFKMAGHDDKYRTLLGQEYNGLEIHIQIRKAR